jgi:hypothetical protein
MNDGAKAIFIGGLACGVLDITQAFIGWGLEGVAPIRILQSVASGVLGRASFQGGWPSAGLGLVCHFVIAFGAATVYYLASRKIPFMTNQPVIAGLLYGEIVFWFMQFVVVEFSRAHRRPIAQWDPATIITGPIGHMFLVGLPIALAIKKFAPLSSLRSAL